MFQKITNILFIIIFINKNKTFDLKPEGVLLKRGIQIIFKI